MDLEKKDYIIDGGSIIVYDDSARIGNMRSQVKFSNVYDALSINNALEIASVIETPCNKVLSRKSWGQKLAGKKNKTIDDFNVRDIL